MELAQSAMHRSVVANDFALQVLLKYEQRFENRVSAIR
jgi:hypothetical protein